MKVKVYNLQGQAIKDLDLSDEVFGVKIKPTVVHEVFVAQTNNQREPWADTKNRGEVRGGGRKPWPQKGTGRARHGSIRSPIWKGGGVAFGPLTDRNYKTKINKKIRRAAIRMCLTDKAQSGNFLVAENFAFTEPKTKLFMAFIKSLPIQKKSYLILTDGKDDQVMRMSRNLQKVQTLRAEDVNVMDLLGRQVVIASEAAAAKVAKVFSK